MCIITLIYMIIDRDIMQTLTELLGYRIVKNFEFTCALIPVPSGAPQNLAIINSNCTSVTISWDSVQCIHRNGLITHYIFSYGRGRDGENNQVNVTVNITNPDDGGSFTATGIDNTKNYIFKVAAVNEAGVGMLANVTVSTQRNGNLLQ